MDNQRSRQSLNGKWQLWVDPEGAYTPTSLESSPDFIVAVPAPIQAQANDLHLYTGPVWYRREFEISGNWEAARVYIGFDAVDYRAEVWVNDTLLGDHCGGYLPFEMEASHAIHQGSNTLTVRVTDPPEWFAEIPHGKQSWYGPLSGIWQDVWIERRPETFLKNLDIRPSVANKSVACHANLSGPALESSHLELTLETPSGQKIELENVAVPNGTRSIAWEFSLDGISLWSPAAPDLYRIGAKLVCQENTRDFFSKSFGFRTIEARQGRLYLNGELFYLRGALDQDYYPGTICTPPSRAFVVDEMRKAKKLGLNCLRIHIKVPDPIYYDVADEIGMLIWTELPSFTMLTSHSAKLARETLEGMLARDRHHPSIVAWTIINENWGLELPDDAAHRQWLALTYDWLKGEDPSRLVVDNSACAVNFHIHSDLDDYHHYRAIPDHRQEWKDFVDDFASRPGWTYSPYGDAIRSGEEPLVLSEFGNWGLPDANLLRDEQGREPWWFDTGNDWGAGWVYPHGVQARFHNIGLDRIFGSWEKFIEATQWYEFQALKFEIETIRRRPEIQGYVITELTDVHWECNGLMDMNRRVKAFGSRLATVNADTIVSAEVERTAWWANEPIPVTFSVANGTGAAYQDLRLHWKAKAWGAEGFLPIAEVSPGDVVVAERAVVPMTAILQSAREQVLLELVDSHGQKIASNTLELSLYPPRQKDAFKSRTVWCEEDLLAQDCERIGYSVTATAGEADVLVASQANLDLLALVNEGAHLLLLAEDEKALPTRLFGLGTADVGERDWITPFGWLRRDGPFSNIPGGPLIDDSFETVIPGYNLTGFGVSEFQNSTSAGTTIFSGQFLGWAHKPSAWIGRRYYGQGLVLASTFKLRANIMVNPLAITLFDDMISLAAQNGNPFADLCDG